MKALPFLRLGIFFPIFKLKITYIRERAQKQLKQGNAALPHIWIKKTSTVIVCDVKNIFFVSLNGWTQENKNCGNKKNTVFIAKFLYLRIIYDLLLFFVYSLHLRSRNGRLEI